MTYQYSLNLCFPFCLLVIVDHENDSVVTLIMKMLMNCSKQKTSVTVNEENFRCNTGHIFPSLVSIFKFCCSYADVTIHKTVKLLLIDFVA